jgi:hypothetical protein
MMNKNQCSTKLSKCSLGLGIGIAEGLFMMLFAWAGWFFDYGTSLIEQVASFYYGYAATFVGGLWGGLWGFILGFFFGIVIAVVYNFCSCKCCKKYCSLENKDIPR